MNEAYYNGKAWDEEARKGNYWTLPASDEDVEAAKGGDLKVRLTPKAFVKDSWIKGCKGKRVLLLASGGGQQTVLFAAYGAKVTSIDASSEQIKRDLEGLEKHSLDGLAMVGDMRDLGALEGNSFDFVFIPHSINFISDLSPLYDGMDRTLKKGGHFLFGVANPVLYLFDEKKEERGKLKVKYTLPFSDERSRSRKEVEKMIREKDTFESSHTLSSILSPLFEKGYVLTDFYSDSSLNDLVDSYIHDSFLAFNFLKS